MDRGMSAGMCIRTHSVKFVEIRLTTVPHANMIRKRNCVAGVNGLYTIGAYLPKRCIYDNFYEVSHSKLRQVLHRELDSDHDPYYLWPRHPWPVLPWS